MPVPVLVIWIIVTIAGMAFATLCHATAMWLHEETWRLIFGLPPRPQPFYVRFWRLWFSGYNPEDKDK